MPHTTYPGFTPDGLAAVRAGTDRPLLLTNATVHTLDPLIGTLRGADVPIGGDLVVGVGPGIVTAAEDDGAVVIDATGTTVLPSRLEASTALGRTSRAPAPGRSPRAPTRGSSSSRKSTPPTCLPPCTRRSPGPSSCSRCWTPVGPSADGRDDETRGGRPHAFQGRYWVAGDRVDYLDDLGFWAFGQFDGDALHHAGYTMHMHNEETAR